jgi:prevent-host-death family protein
MIAVLDASAAIENAIYKTSSALLKETLLKADLVLAPDIFPSEITNAFWKYGAFSNPFAGFPLFELKRHENGCNIALSGLCNSGEALMNTQVSIGQVKRDISELVNRVSYAGERIILTSRGKPKAALISIKDYERLQKSENRAGEIQKWLADTRALSTKIEKRQGHVDADSILATDRDDLEQR